MSLLSRITPDRVIAEPFPHVVVEHAIEPELCRRLIREFPPAESFTRGKSYRSNHKIYRRGVEALRDRSLSEAWREIVAEHLEPSLWHDLVRVFRPHLLREYPDFERRFGRMDGFRVGSWGLHDFSSRDLLLDSKLLLHTPVVGESAVERDPHFKRFSSLFFGYLYLRPDADDSAGGDHAFYSLKPGGELVLDKRQTLDPSLVNLEKLIPLLYEYAPLNPEQHAALRRAIPADGPPLHRLPARRAVYAPDEAGRRAVADGPRGGGARPAEVAGGMASVARRQSGRVISETIRRPS
jgi:hypothetical protein